MSHNSTKTNNEDDVLLLALKASESNFNVRQFKKMKAHKSYKFNQNNKYQTTVDRLYTQNKSQKQSQIQTSANFNKSTDTLNKNLRYKSTFIKPIGHNRAKFFSKSIKKSNEQDLMKGGKQSNIQKHERAWAKGKVKQKCLEQWLNSILLEFYHNEYFDKSIPKCALKKYGIDQNSLITIGMLPNNISRLYRGLFVFSMGFNDLILQLCNGNNEITKIIWKIYSIILQYCSKGGMQTAVGQIERQSFAKVQILTSQISKKQEIIQKNEQINEQNNNEIYNQIKRLRQQNINLNNEKQVLIDQYNITQQAFSEEVHLRLKFEAKINEIYGMHQQLNLKHDKLFKTFSIKVQELYKQSQKYFQVAQKLTYFKSKLIIAKQDSDGLRINLENTQKHLNKLIQDRLNLIKKINQMEIAVNQNKITLMEYRAKEQMWNNDKENLKAALQFRQKSAKETHQEYQITLQENNRLYYQLSDQRKIMEQYEKEKKNFNTKIISIISQNSLLKRKNDEFSKDIDRYLQNEKMISKQLEKIRFDNEIMKKNEESNKISYNLNQQNLAKLRQLHLQAEQQLDYLRKYHKNMDKLLKDKNKKQKDLQLKLSKIQQTNQTLNEELTQIKSKYSILSNQYKSRMQQFKIKQDKLQLLNQQLAIREEDFQIKRSNLQDQVQKFRGMSDAFNRDLKDQKFQRNTQTYSYNNALRTLTMKNEEQRKFRVKISFLEGQIQNLINRYNILQCNMLRMISQFAQHQQALESTLQQQRKMIVDTQSNLHPMLFEDLLSRLKRQEQNRLKNTSEIQRLAIQIQKQQMIRKNEIQGIQQQYRWQINKIKIEAERKRQELSNEIVYIKEKNEKFKETIRQYEQLAQVYKKTIYEKSTSQREQTYRYMLQQKKKQIDSLYQQIQRTQDALSKSKHKIDEMVSSNEKLLSQFNQKNQKKLIQAKKQIQTQIQAKYKQLYKNVKVQYQKKIEQIKYQQQNKIKKMSLEQIIQIKQMGIQQFVQKLYQLSNDPKIGKFHDNYRSGNFKAQLTYGKDRYTNNRQLSYKEYWKDELKRMKEEGFKGRDIKNKIHNAYTYYDRE